MLATPSCTWVGGRRFRDKTPNCTHFEQLARLLHVGDAGHLADGPVDSFDAQKRVAGQVLVLGEKLEPVPTAKVTLIFKKVYNLFIQKNVKSKQMLKNSHPT